MKKMATLEKTGMDFVFYGLSTEKGIFIRPEKSKEYNEGEIKNLKIILYPGAFVSVENGKIVLNPEINDANEITQEQNKNKENKVIKLKKKFVIASVLSAIAIFPCAFINEYLSTFVLAMTFIFSGCIGITSVIYDFFKRLMKDEGIIQMHKFHAAEHAVINAYYDLKRVPTMEEIKNYSSFSYYCGIAQAFKEVWVLLGVGICRLAPGYWYFLTIAMFLLFSVWAHKKKLYFTEVFALAKPTELEYGVAIKCMEAAIGEKENIDNIFKMII